jgi:hypothetical protein
MDKRPREEQMSEETTRHALQIHPAIAYYENTGLRTAEVTGYIGSEREGGIRIYSDMAATSFVDIKKDDVIDVSKVDGSVGMVRVLICHDASLMVSQAAITATDVQGLIDLLAELSHSDPTTSLSIIARARMENCETKYALDAQKVQALRALAAAADLRSQTEDDPDAADRWRNEAGRLSDEAVVIVETARPRLEKCLSTGPGRIPFRGGVGAFVAEVIAKYPFS